MEKKKERYVYIKQSETIRRQAAEKRKREEEDDDMIKLRVELRKKRMQGRDGLK